MPKQIGHLQGVTSNTTWSEFVTLITDTFQPRHATNDLIQRIRSLRMHSHDLQTYINDLEKLKHLIPPEAQSDLDMMYTFINGLTPEIHSEMMYKDITSYTDVLKPQISAEKFTWHTHMANKNSAQHLIARTVQHPIHLTDTHMQTPTEISVTGVWSGDGLDLFFLFLNFEEMFCDVFVLVVSVMLLLF